METFFQDLRYGLRMLAKSPGFTAIAILTLALGIGANTALFSVVNGVLLNPLAYPHSGQLVALYGKTPGIDHAAVSYLNFLDWQRDTQTFSSMAIYRNQDYNFIGKGEGERLTGYMISADFFSTLGVTPLLGRTFRPDDDHTGAAPVVILGGGFWKRQFGSSLEIIGKPIILNGTSYTIVGVVPAGFTFYGHDRDVYTPIGQWTDANFRDRRVDVSAHAIGRLKTGVTLAQAKADMDAISQNLAAAFPEADKAVGVTLVADEGRYCRQCPAISARASGGCWFLAADCVRERRQSSSRACHGPLARIRDSRGDGSGPRSCHSPASYRKHRPCGLGRRAWDSCSPSGAPTRCLALCRGFAARQRSIARLTRPALYHGALAICRNCFWPRARAENVPRGFAGNSQGERTRRERRAPPAARSFRGRRNSHGPGFACRRGADGSQSGGALARQSRLQSQPRDHVQFVAAGFAHHDLRRNARPPAPVRRQNAEASLECKPFPSPSVRAR